MIMEVLKVALTAEDVVVKMAKAAKYCAVAAGVACAVEKFTKSIREQDAKKKEETYSY